MLIKNNENNEEELKIFEIPNLTKDFLNYLEEIYEDSFQTDGEVGSPDYWKKAGVIELIRETKELMNQGN